MTTISIFDIINYAKKIDNTVSFIEQKLFPDTRSELEKRLQKFYDGVVEDFRKIYPDEEKDYKKLAKKSNDVKKDLIRENTQQFAFYDAQVFANIFLAFNVILAGREPNYKQKIIDEISENENILYTEQAIDDFIEFFNAKLFSEAELRLFLLPFSIDRQDTKLDEIIELLNKIARLPNEVKAIGTKLEEITEKIVKKN